MNLIKLPKGQHIIIINPTDMIYQTKHIIDDIVWVVYDNRVVAGKVIQVVVKKTRELPVGEEEITLVTEGRAVDRPASLCFSTKAELLASL